MSKTVLDVVTASLRMLKVIGSGRAPSADMAADALVSLQGIFSHLVETEVFGPLSCVLLTEAYTAGENESLSGAYAVTLPTTLTDSRTGETRAPKDRAIVAIAENVATVDGSAVDAPQTWLYDARKAEWVALHDLALTDDCPLGDRFFEGLSAMLAVQISDDYSAELSPRIAEASRRGRRALTRKDNFTPQPVAWPLLRTSNRMHGDYQ